MTLNGVMAVISPNSVASGAHCVKVVEDVVVIKFTFAISSPDEFLVVLCISDMCANACAPKTTLP